MVLEEITGRVENCRRQTGRHHNISRPAAEKRDHRHRLLLPARRQRPRCRAAEQGDEVPPFQANHRIFLPRRGRRSYQPGHGAQPVCRRWSLPGARSAGPWGRLECFWIEVAAVRYLCGISHSPLPPASSRTSATMRRRAAGSRYSHERLGEPKPVLTRNEIVDIGRFVVAAIVFRCAAGFSEE